MRDAFDQMDLLEAFLSEQGMLPVTPAKRQTTRCREGAKRSHRLFSSIMSKIWIRFNATWSPLSFLLARNTVLNFPLPTEPEKVLVAFDVFAQTTPSRTDRFEFFVLLKFFIIHSNSNSSIFGTYSDYFATIRSHRLDCCKLLAPMDLP